MTVHYESYDGLPPEPRLTALLDLLIAVFPDQSRNELVADLTYQLIHRPFLTLLAVSDAGVVGCKLGYEQKPDQFYSWLGCVAPAHRGRGIAAELMRRQHDWCRQQEYRIIRTQTYNQWRDMLVLNLRFGFDIVGTVQGRPVRRCDGLTIVLEKTL